METENGAWYSRAESIRAQRSAFASITFLGKGKAPQPPYFGLFPAASSKQDEHNPWCLAAPIPSFPLLSPSPGLCFHLPMDALETQLPSKAMSRCVRQDLELCWCCPWAEPSGAASVTRGCSQNKELLHRHVSNCVCCEEQENTGTNLRAQKPPHAENR